MDEKRNITSISINKNSQKNNYDNADKHSIDILKELPEDYGNFLKLIKQRVKAERIKVILSANASQILMYWDIGHDILFKQEQSGWGAKIIDRLAKDMKVSFPTMKGFSARNLKYMRKFAKEWKDREIVQRSVAQIPWRSNL